MENKDAAGLTVDSTEKGTFFLVRVKGRLIAKHILTVRRTLEQAMDIGHTRIALDLALVDYMDSMGIGLIVNFNKKIRAADGRLFIVNPSPVASDIIEVSGTDAFLDVRRDVKDPDQLFS